MTRGLAPSRVRIRENICHFACAFMTLYRIALSSRSSCRIGLTRYWNWVTRWMSSPSTEKKFLWASLAFNDSFNRFSHRLCPNKQIPKLACLPMNLAWTCFPHSMQVGSGESGLPLIFQHISSGCWQRKWFRMSSLLVYVLSHPSMTHFHGIGFPSTFLDAMKENLYVAPSPKSGRDRGARAGQPYAWFAASLCHCKDVSQHSFHRYSNSPLWLFVLIRRYQFLWPWIGTLGTMIIQVALFLDLQ